MSANNKEENIKKNQKSSKDNNLEGTKSPDKSSEEVSNEVKEKTIEEKLKEAEEKLLRSLAEIENQRKRLIIDTRKNLYKLGKTYEIESSNNSFNNDDIGVSKSPINSLDITCDFFLL